MAQDETGIFYVSVVLVSTHACEMGVEGLCSILSWFSLQNNMFVNVYHHHNVRLDYIMHCRCMKKSPTIKNGNKDVTRPVTLMCCDKYCLCFNALLYFVYFIGRSRLIYELIFSFISSTPYQQYNQYKIIRIDNCYYKNATVRSLSSFSWVMITRKNRFS